MAGRWPPGGGCAALLGRAAFALGAAWAGAGAGFGVGAGGGWAPDGVGWLGVWPWAQPEGFTAAPTGVLGHLSSPSSTPSPSSSPGHPRASTVAPRGVSEQRSRPSGIPSPSLSLGQPRASTSTPDGVSGHRSRPSGMLSPSESWEQPRASTVAPATVVGQRSMPSGTPSPSLSLGQPWGSTVAPAGVSGQRSLLSRTPSLSESRMGLLPSIRLTPRLTPKLERETPLVAALDLLLLCPKRPSARAMMVGDSPSRNPAPPINVPLLPQIGLSGLATGGQSPPYLVLPPPSLR